MAVLTSFCGKALPMPVQCHFRSGGSGKVTETPPTIGNTSSRGASPTSTEHLISTPFSPACSAPTCTAMCASVASHTRSRTNCTVSPLPRVLMCWMTGRVLPNSHVVNLKLARGISSDTWPWISCSSFVVSRFSMLRVVQGHIVSTTIWKGASSSSRSEVQPRVSVSRSAASVLVLALEGPNLSLVFRQVGLRLKLSSSIFSSTHGAGRSSFVASFSSTEGSSAFGYEQLQQPRASSAPGTTLVSGS
mmetsp:Transcript_58463/g.157614  ORF Transcript_58463/g.157614 Transcript_58463/m.157614 type:complete len:247 (+) Transcript_58463:1510-2250(+)